MFLKATTFSLWLTSSLRYFMEESRHIQDKKPTVSLTGRCGFVWYLWRIQAVSAVDRGNRSRDQVECDSLFILQSYCYNHSIIIYGFSVYSLYWNVNNRSFCEQFIYIEFINLAFRNCFYIQFVSTSWNSNAFTVSCYITSFIVR